MSNDPLSRFAVGGAQRPDSFSGMNPAFSSALLRMFQNAPPEVQNQLRVSSGFRSVARQQELWDASDKSGKMVARPGHSQHNHGMAADLQYLNPAAREWAQKNAAQYGLAFPMSYEPWHVELAGARGKAAPTPTSLAAAVAPAPGPAPQMLGDMVAPPAPDVGVPMAAAAPGIGDAIAGFLQSRQKREQDAAANSARRQALFGGLGDLYAPT